jgi:hypothetical protein
LHGNADGNASSQDWSIPLGDALQLVFIVAGGALALVSLMVGLVSLVAFLNDRRVSGALSTMKNVQRTVEGILEITSEGLRASVSALDNVYVWIDYEVSAGIWAAQGGTVPKEAGEWQAEAHASIRLHRDAIQRAQSEVERLRRDLSR